MPVLSLACHLPHNAPHIAWRYNYEQTTKQTKVINNSYIYINISCKCDTNRAGHLTLDAYASRPVACCLYLGRPPLASKSLPIYWFCGVTWNHWVIDLLTCALRRSIVLQFFWHVDTHPILPFLFFFNSTFYLCIIIVIFYLMYLIH